MKEEDIVELIELLKSKSNKKIKKAYVEVFDNNPFVLYSRSEIENFILSCDEKRLSVKQRKKDGHTMYISSMILNKIVSYEIETKKGYTEIILQFNKVTYRIIMIE